jgi:hypothetical protein
MTQARSRINLYNCKVHEWVIWHTNELRGKYPTLNLYVPFPYLLSTPKENNFPAAGIVLAESGDIVEYYSEKQSLRPERNCGCS